MPQPLSLPGVKGEHLVATYLPLCNFDGHFWPKKKALFYVAFGHGAVFDRWRLRFCPSHAGDVDQYLSQAELGAVENTLSRIKIMAAECFACGQPLGEEPWQCFVTGYPAQDERKDYWFQVHSSCSLPSYLVDGYSA